MVAREIAARRQRAHAALIVACERLVELLALPAPDLGYSISGRKADPALAELAELERVVVIVQHTLMKLAHEERRSTRVEKQPTA